MEDYAVNKETKRWMWIIIGAVFLIIAYFLPLPEGLSQAGKMAIAIMIWTIFMWLTEPLPMAATGFMGLALIAFLGVLPWNTMYTSFINMVFFFLISTYAITIALEKTTIPERMSRFIMKKSGKRSYLIVGGIFTAITILSAIMSNVPSCLIGVGLGLAILKANGDPKPGTSNLGKCLMMAAAWGAMVGGFTTPAGTPHDLMAIQFAYDATGTTITFLGWMLLAIPCSIFCIVVGTFCLVKFFPPEPISDEAIAAVNAQEELPPLNAKEKKLLIIVGLMMACWISSTWIPSLNIVGVAIIGLLLMFFPGIDILTWKEFNAGVSWGIVLMVGSITGMASAIMQTGATQWMVDGIFANATSWGATQFTAIVATLGAALHCIVPAGPAIVGLAVSPLSMIAELVGANVQVVVVSFTIFATVTFVLPVDTIPLLTYDRGYWKFSDMIKVGIIPTIALILFMTFILPIWARILGLT
jgi:sodium-dependent dicarboxylate transporter 2/3/5